MLPSLFVAHGAPLLAIENNEYTQYLEGLGAKCPKPKDVVLFSAHWESRTQKVSKVDEFETIHDFGGFPQALYEIKYPARGEHSVTKEIEEAFRNQGIPYELDTKRGLDHGAWVVLRMIYPNADIPVISMSVNPNLSPMEQYNIGKTLSHLREEDILIVASGGTVHNLGVLKLGNDDGTIDQWALDFDSWLENKLVRWDLDALFNYSSLAPSAELAVPSYGKEHFIPIFYAMGAADIQKRAKLLHRSFRYGNLSHSVWQFGETQ
ncbi:DODA-type extradiol aromatic ring-opening family dioxygenase [Terrihalobacillus insolitus]|uniref:DODA-type extradiol aromatic ring-opening family dioxygenase n=1 Tax=Terrihalobacillus insolitus TaxID=2950438 RepID=UPI002342591C|nr:class III extradiol ring-cleavage dioxygenase [Terrihalobacillus insolitus]MDC3413880.1 dioxygenase [Terrihalobacillus insolitus]